MADTVAALVDARMQLRVGPLAEAVARADPDSDAAYIPPDATLGEVAGRDPDYGARMRDEVRAGTRMAGHPAGAAAAYAPVLRDMARQLAQPWRREADPARRCPLPFQRKGLVEGTSVPGRGDIGCPRRHKKN